MAAEWIELEVDASRMRALLQVPAAGAGAPLPGATLPGVVVCMHAPGIDAFMQDVAGQLRDAGFACIVPDLYHRQDPDDGSGPLERMGRLHDDELFRDLAAAAAALRMRPGVGARRLAVIGFCMGGRIAVLQAARDATLNAAVAFYPGNIDQAWGTGDQGRTPLQWAEQLRAPVLGLFGADDTNPGPAHRAALGAVLARAGVLHDLRSYPGCGHAFLNFQRPTYRPEAAADAWARCIDWLRTHIPPAGAPA